MRIRGRRRDADGNPSLPSPLQFFDCQTKPPPSPPADRGAEPPDAQQDDSSTAFREHIAPSSPRSSPPTASPPPSCRFCDECEDADRGEKGRYAQLSDILKGRPRRTYRSSRRQFKRGKDAGGLRLEAAATNKLELLCAAVCSDKNLIDLAEECKKEEIGSGSEDHEFQGSPERSKEGSSEKKGLRRGRRTASWGIDIRRQFGLHRATRTNNSHWTYDEVNQLVDGVASLGVGRWTELKTTFFPTSIRTAQHLKDKWRNLLIACGLQVGRKKKVDAIRVTNGLRDRIIALHEKHMLTRKRRGSSAE